MKHSNAYSIEGNYRESVSKWVSVIAVSMFFAVNTYLTPFATEALSCIFEDGPFFKFVIGIALSMISAFLFYSILWWWFDRYLWRWKPFIKWHHIRNLNGIWEGKGISSFKDECGNNVEYFLRLTIKQTFTKIACEVETRNSHSSGVLMGVQCSDDLATGCYLNMVYANKTRSEGSTNIKTWPSEHRGFCSYWIDGKDMVGNYFTNSDPQTRGRIFLQLQEASHSR